jgi:hypothetical protein
MRGSMAWIFGNRRLEKLNSLSKSCPTAPVPVIAALEIRFVGCGINRVRLCQMCVVLRRQFDSNLACNGLGASSLGLFSFAPLTPRS